MRFAFVALLLLYPLLSLLWRRDYPWSAPEVWLLAGLLVGVAMLIAALAAHLRPVIGALLTALLVTLVFLVQFDLYFVGLLAVFAASWGLAAALGPRFARYGLPVLAALVLGAWLDARWQPAAPPAASAPAVADSARAPVVHLLLDGFIGPDGLVGLPGGDTARTELMDFLERHGFTVFPRAYSRYGVTRDSLQSAFNFMHGDQPVGPSATLKQHRQVDNRLFEDAAAAGYRLRVYQTDYLDLCTFGAHQAQVCWRYPQPNLLAGRAQRPLGTRVAILAQVLLGQSWLVGGRVGANDWLSRAEVAMHDPAVLDRLASDLGQAANGAYHFAHLLLPHAPFVFGPDCAPVYEGATWQYWQANKRRYTSDPDGPVRQARIGLYLDQQACALTSLEDLFQAMRAAGIWERSTVILHGDHGPLISARRPSVRTMHQLSRADYRVNHSTLFAVRRPGVGFAVDSRPLSLGLLMEWYARDLLPGGSGQASGSVGWPAGWPQDPERTGQYVYLSGTYPLRRVDIELFAD